jgi:cytochrome c-type biogenesis protein CcmF
MFALVTNVQVGWRIARTNPRLAGGAVAHIGVGLLLLGCVVSSEYDRKQTVSLPQGKSVEALGFRLTYEGFHEFEKDRYEFKIRVEREKMDIVLKPVMFFSTYNNGVMRHPDIANLLLRDLYLAPLSLDQQERVQQPAMQKGNGAAGTAKEDVLVVDVSIKPLINLVWAGVIVLLAGFLITIIRRAPEGAQMRTESEPQGEGEVTPTARAAR